MGQFTGDGKVQILTATSGQPLTLECFNQPESYPRSHIHWTLQSTTTKTLKPLNSSQITVDPEGSLHFSNITKEDEMDGYLYACVVTNAFLNEQRIGSQTTIKVEQASSPVKTTTSLPVKQFLSHPIVHALKGGHLELACIFGGTAELKVKFRV